MRRLILASLFFVVVLTSAYSQPAKGNYAHGAFDSKTFDTVNIGNLNAAFSIPIYSKPGRGLPFYYNLAYNSSVWTPASVSGTNTWVPDLNWGWRGQTDVVTGYSTDKIIGTGTCSRTPPLRTLLYQIYGSWVYHDVLGVAHNFDTVQVANTNSCIDPLTPASVVPQYASQTDAFGYTLTALISPANGFTVTVTTPTGMTVTAPFNRYSGSGSTADANGNTVSINGSGQFTDTTGNVALTVAGTAPTSTTYTYTDTTNTSRAVTMAYTSYSVQTAFGCSGISEYGPTTAYLVSSISYPDGTSYSFTYEPTPGVSGKVTGRLASVTMPEGGTINYAYSGGSNGIVCADGGTATLTRSMPNDPLTPSTTYARTPGTNATHTDVVDGLSNHAKYDFVNDPADPFLTPYLINHIQYQGVASGTPLLSEQSCLNGATPDCTGQSLTLPITSISTTSTLNGSSVKRSVQTFNAYGLITDDAEYDFGSGSPGSEILETQYTYASLTNGIVNLPATITTLAPSGGSMAAISTVSYSYDGNSLTATSGLPQHSSVSGSRGNLTSIQYATGASSPTTVTTAQGYYDDAGQLVTSYDAASNATTFAYDSSTDTFLTSVTYPTTGSVTHSTSSTYDAIRGVKLTDVDQNSNTTTYTYDNMLRPSTISSAGGGYKSFTYSYGSTSPYTSVSTLHATGGASITATTYLDPYGRQIKLDTTDTPSDDVVVYAYDANGNLYSVSNPYRSGGTVSSTTYSFDALSRPTTQYDSDGSSQQTASYSGNTVTISDEAGHQRALVTDGLGRTSKVFEPNSSGSLTLETDYLYAQNVTAGSGSTFTTFQNIVNQKGGSTSSSNWRTRTFTYDILGREVTGTTPEAGTTAYTYPNGSGSCAGIITLACTRTDANSTSTTYAYDALNRLTGKTYGGSSIGTGTSSVSYSYDQTSYNGLTITNGKGLRTGMSDGSGTTAWSFDGVGRALAIRKTINSVTKQANFTYNADGTANTVQDYGGTTFTYSYNVGGLPTSIVDGSSNTYASGAVYNAASELTSLNHQLTSGGGAYVRSIQYNNRLQPSTISASLGGTNIQSLTYGYGSGGTNNGNILNITNGMGSNRSQTYTYDNLNRLASGRDVSHWGETYTYDNWGNLYQTSQMSGLGGNNWSVTASTKNQLSNLSYDSAGQVTMDQFSNAYTYDAEGRLLTAGTGTYVYDGDGNRVKKTASSITTLYWPGTSGVLDESNSSGSTMGKQVQFAGLLVWHENTAGAGKFLFHDHLGSVRVTGSASGSLADDNDYQSFGNLYHNYGSSYSDNHYLFTGYESDIAESSTDYAIYRNLSPSMGRFNRPDPYDGSYDPTNPQSLNRYAYVSGSPLTSIDPLGLMEFACRGDGNLDDPEITCFIYEGGGIGSGGSSGGGGGGGGGGDGPPAPNNGLNPVGPNPCSGANPANLNYSAVNNYRGGPMTALNHIAMNHINSVPGKSTYSGGPGGPFGAVGNMMRLNALTLTQGTLMSVSSNGAIVLTYFEPSGSIVLGPITLTYGTVGTDQNGARTQYNTLVVKGCTVPQTSYPGTPFPLQP